jgi:hypothetical protein
MVLGIGRQKWLEVHEMEVFVVFFFWPQPCLLRKDVASSMPRGGH